MVVKWPSQRIIVGWKARQNIGKVSGFAFGLGPQRITMLLHAIDDIRQFWANDLRFLWHFSNVLFAGWGTETSVVECQDSPTASGQ